MEGRLLRERAIDAESNDIVDDWIQKRAKASKRRELFGFRQDRERRDVDEKSISFSRSQGFVVQVATNETARIFGDGHVASSCAQVDDKLVQVDPSFFSSSQLLGSDDGFSGRLGACFVRHPEVGLVVRKSL